MATPQGFGAPPGWVAVRAPGSGGGRLGQLVGVGAGVDGVQHGQLGVVDRPVGEVEGVGGRGLGPGGVAGRGPGVPRSGFRDVWLLTALAGGVAIGGMVASRTFLQLVSIVMMEES